MPTPTRTVEAIRKHGFRRWYERQLVESHLFLVTAVLALIVMASGLELLSIRETAGDAILAAVLAAAGAGLAWYCWRRYVTLMMRAEHVGHQAGCPVCKRHGFRPVPPAECAVADRPGLLGASCRGCGHRWSIDVGD